MPTYWCFKKWWKVDKTGHFKKWWDQTCARHPHCKWHIILVTFYWGVWPLIGICIGLLLSWLCLFIDAVLRSLCYFFVINNLIFKLELQNQIKIKLQNLQTSQLWITSWMRISQTHVTFHLVTATTQLGGWILMDAPPHRALQSLLLSGPHTGCSWRLQSKL